MTTIWSTQAKRQNRAHRVDDRRMRLARHSSVDLLVKLRSARARYLREDIKFVLSMREDWRDAATVARWSPEPKAL